MVINMVDRVQFLVTKRGEPSRVLVVERSRAKEERARLNREGYRVRSGTTVGGKYEGRFRKESGKVEFGKQTTKTVIVPSQKKAIGVSPGVARKIEKEVLPIQEHQEQRQKQIRRQVVKPKPPEVYEERFLYKDLPFRKPITEAMTTQIPVIIKPAKPASITIDKDGRFKSVSTSVVTTSKTPYEDILAQKAFEELQLMESKRLYGSLTGFEKTAAHTHTLLSGKSFEYLASPFQKGLTKKDIVIEKLVQTQWEKEGDETKLKLFGRGALQSLSSAPVMVETAFLGSALFGGFGATRVGGKILSTTASKVGMTGLGVFGVGSVGVDIYGDIQEGAVARGVGKGITFGASIFAGAKGYKAGKHDYDIWRTRGMTEISLPDMVPEDVLSGKKIFPKAGTEKMTAIQRAKIHKGLFEHESFRLPGQEKPLGFHATGTEWKNLVAGAGKRELKGVYTSYGVSPHFLRISGKQKLKLFGYDTTVGKQPTIYGLEPTDIKINIAKKTAKGWEFTQPTQKGIMHVPGMKTEVESLFTPGTKFTQTGKDFFVSILGRKVPIITAKATAGVGGAITGAVVSPLTKTRPTGILESLGISPQSYFITPGSLFAPSIISLSSSKKKGVKSSIDIRTSLSSYKTTGLSSRPISMVGVIPSRVSRPSPTLSSIIGLPKSTKYKTRRPRPSKVSRPISRLSSIVALPRSSRYKTKRPRPPVSTFIKFPSFRAPQPRKLKKTRSKKYKRRRGKGMSDIIPLSDMLSLLQTEARTGKKALHPRITFDIEEAFVQEFTSRPATGRFPTSFQIRERRKSKKKVSRRSKTKKRKR